jgi:hypothetical protein
MRYYIARGILMEEFFNGILGQFQWWRKRRKGTWYPVHDLSKESEPPIWHKEKSPAISETQFIDKNLVERY